ncbi:mitochondrial import inner membrane translocase subunit tim-16 [Parathielavia hyrcaniae]|uniref:Mitochondrial import inner membrane translocase subunit TIM16 n=1 Tax=Parathielavia hyrcaniae TaxID=113614 RepID=A0AAN6PX96_9PEZI|nr:mitochondrial import inner membrane translocase subunit tim-16 [Parathielavia hyrcaniae]
MAYRYITQAVIIGTRVVGRAFAEAYRQASASSQYQRAQAKNGGGSGASGRSNLSSGMTLDEACKILNVKPPQNGKGDIDEVMERFKRLFDSNDPNKGGSFYLQSKILRARERLEAEIKPAAEKAQQEAEVKEGWNPKLYKDR